MNKKRDWWKFREGHSGNLYLHWVWNKFEKLAGLGPYLQHPDNELLVLMPVEFAC